MLRIATVILIYHRHKSIDCINQLGSQRRRNMFPVRCGRTYRVELSFEQKIGRWIISRIMIVIHHRHKPIDDFLTN
jgi:hypothetical protein